MVIGRRRQKRLTLAAVAGTLALLPAALDLTAVAAVSPRITGEMNLARFYPLVLTTYLVAAGALAPLAGKLVDRGSGKAMLLIGLAGFMGGSALCAVSDNIVQLIYSRAIQGGFAALLLGGTFRIVPEIWGPDLEERIRGLLATAAGVAVILGPVAGGLLTDNLGWRWVFYANIPTGAIAALALAYGLPSKASSTSGPRPDLKGAAALLALATSLVVALATLSILPFDARLVAAMFTLAALMLVVFLVTEARSESPILPLDYLRSRTFRAVMAIAFFTAFGCFATLLFGPALMQGSMGISATAAGATMIAMGIGAAIAWVVTALLVRRFGPSRLLGTIGLGFMVVGLWNLSQVTSAADLLRVVVSVFVVGLGLGTTVPIAAGSAHLVRPERSDGFTAEQVQLFRLLGGAVAAALLGAMLTDGLARQVQVALPTAGPGGPLRYAYLMAAVVVAAAAVVSIVRWRHPSEARSDDRAAPGKRPTGLSTVADEICREYEFELRTRDQLISLLRLRVRTAAGRNRNLECRIAFLTAELARSRADLVRASENTLSLALTTADGAATSAGPHNLAHEEA